MKKIFFIALMTTISFMVSSGTKVLLTVGENTMTATLVDNEATRELKELLEKSPVTIRMSDYGGFEKVGELPQYFSTSDTHITTEPGDIMLYQGNNMVVFYGSNSWSYTRLGKIDGASVSNVKEMLGSGDITLTLSLAPSSAVEQLSADTSKDDIIFDLKGNRINQKTLSPGMYIINGKKILVSR